VRPAATSSCCICSGEHIKYARYAHHRLYVVCRGHSATRRAGHVATQQQRQDRLSVLGRHICNDSDYHLVACSFAQQLLCKVMTRGCCYVHQIKHGAASAAAFASQSKAYELPRPSGHAHKGCSPRAVGNRDKINHGFCFVKLVCGPMQVVCRPTAPTAAPQSSHKSVQICSR
jgi:hypothetical protein